MISKKTFVLLLITLTWLTQTLVAGSGISNIEVNVKNEIFWGNKLLKSNRINDIEAYLKRFPYSPYESRLRRRLLKLKRANPGQQSGQSAGAPDIHLTNPTQSNAASQNQTPKIEPPVTDLSTQSSEITPETAQDEKSEPTPKAAATAEEKPKEENAQPAKDANEKKEKEEEAYHRTNWSKIEIGIPYEVVITDDDGNTVDTTSTNTGIFAGWSSDIMFGIGGGTAVEYFTKEISSTGDELRHLYFEGILRGTLFDLVNWGAGLGYGLTDVILSSSNGITTTPGQGMIKTLSVGIIWRSFGLNYIWGTFEGSYNWASSSGSSGTTNWSGTIQYLTFEYAY